MNSQAMNMVNAVTGQRIPGYFLSATDNFAIEIVRMWGVVQEAAGDSVASEKIMDRANEMSDCFCENVCHQPKNEEPEPPQEPNRYRCHKEVTAYKIVTGIDMLDGTGKLFLEAEGSRMIDTRVGKEYLDKHNPQPGGYYIIYADGYKSYSPAEAFEAGYTKL